MPYNVENNNYNNYEIYLFQVEGAIDHYKL